MVYTDREADLSPVCKYLCPLLQSRSATKKERDSPLFYVFTEVLTPYKSSTYRF